MKIEGGKMSDKEKNPDFTIEMEEELELDDSIFESDENLEEKAKETDELLTEEELENLIIGIDEENDILDIPDEEEVLEELKFMEESFSVPKESKKEDIKKEEKTETSKKVKREKKEKKNREPFNLQYFLIKNKFKLFLGFIIFILGIFALTFLLVLDKKPKVEEFEMGTTTGAAVAIEENKENMVNEVDLSQEDKELEELKEKLKSIKDDAQKLDLQNKILEIENKKILKIREAKILELKKYYDENFNSLRVSIIKSEEKVLVAAFIATKSDYEKELYEALRKSFEDNYGIDKVSFSVIEQGEMIKILGNITVDYKKFGEIDLMNKTIKEKLQLMKFE